MAHGNRIADGDRTELDRCAGGLAYAGFHIGRELVEMNVARCDFIPGTGDADHRLVDVVVGHAHCMEHGSVWRSLRTFGYSPTTMLQTMVNHFGIPLSTR